MESDNKMSKCSTSNQIKKANVKSFYDKKKEVNKNNEIG